MEAFAGGASGLEGDLLSLSAYEAKHFLWRTEGPVGILTLYRPGRKNALTFEAYREMRDLFRLLPRARDVKAVVLTGEGGDFCSGGDVREIIGTLVRSDTPTLLRFTRLTGEVVRAICSCPQPVVAAVDGVCVGAGAVLALAADIRLGTPRARVAFLFPRVGLSGADMGAAALLPRVVGFGRAMELLLTGRFLEGEEAERWGFFNRLHPPEELLPRAKELALQLAQGPTFAHGITKAMVYQEWGLGLAEALEAEAQAQALCMATRDFARGYEAFLRREEPRFEGD